MNRFVKTASVAVVAFAFLSVSGCSKKKEEEKKSETTESLELSGAETTMTTIEQGMVPGSLAIESPSLNLQNPCAGTSGFIDCQPVLLKLWLSLSKQTFSITKELISKLEPNVARVKVGASGTHVVSAENLKIEYKVESSTKYEILMVNTASGNSALHLSVNSGTYEMLLDVAEMPDSGDGEGPSAGKYYGKIVYTSDSEWTAETGFAQIACQDSDVRAPQNLLVRVGKANGVWQGKTMLLSPRWLTQDDATCDTEVTDSTAMNIYYDFVANDAAATAGFFLMPRTVATVAAIPDYAASNFCTNYPSLCSSGVAFGEAHPMTYFANPFCVKPSTATVWSQACESDSSAISTPTYSSTDNWIAASTFASLSYTLPRTILQ